MVDVSDILNDADLCEPFIALRTSGSMQAGRLVPLLPPTPISMFGSVQVADAKTLDQVPEGDRVTGARVFWSTSPMYVTRTGDNEGLSDELVHKGTQYKITKVWDWSQNGFFKAYAVRIKGA